MEVIADLDSALVAAVTRACGKNQGGLQGGDLPAGDAIGSEKVANCLGKDHPLHDDQGHVHHPVVHMARSGKAMPSTD